MSETPSATAEEIWSEALQAAVILAVDPAACGGAIVRGPAGVVRDRWFAVFSACLASGAPVRRVPLNIPDSRLLGGLDLTASLAAGRSIAESGVLAAANGGVIVLPMAERMAPALAAKIALTWDASRVVAERDGVSHSAATRIGVVAYDESVEPDERVPTTLGERLALRIDLTSVTPRSAEEPSAALLAEWVAAANAARGRLREIDVQDETLTALTATALALGIESIRPVLQSIVVARAAAALVGLKCVDDAAATLAARWVLAPRATRLPPAEPSPDDAPDAPPPEPPQAADNPSADADQSADRDKPLEDVLLEAMQTAIPPELLAQLDSGLQRLKGGSAGRAKQQRQARERGRPIGVRAGEWRDGVKLDLVETLRAAVPWQKLRHRRAGRPVQVRASDFRITRFQQRLQTTTIFAVDASGSAALHRLAEVKGAVELLLADCYVRRDQVALIAFRGNRAEVVLPPTRSLVRAKRTLAGLPGGGGTPLALGLDAARELATAVARRGDVPRVVVLTDGRANISRAGTPGRAEAARDAEAAARELRASAVACLFIDASPQPRPELAHLASLAGCRYFALPHADAQSLSRLVRVA
jgi:magnesium chelatase subunit D